MMDISAPVVPVGQLIADLRAAATFQGQHGWAPVHFVDHSIGKLGILGAVRMAVYGIPSYSADPTFVPTEEQRARIWQLSKTLNDYTLGIYGVRYAADWNATVCKDTKTAVAMLNNAADALERRST